MQNSRLFPRLRQWAFRHRLPIGLIIIAVVLRLGIFIALPGIFDFETTGAVHGSEAYIRYAQNLMETGVYGKGAPGIPDAHLPPLYPAALAVVWSVLGRGAGQVALFHTALDAVSITFLYALCLILFGWHRHARRIALVAAAGYAFYPYLLFQNLTLIDTPLFMTLLYGFLLCIALVAQPSTTLKIDRFTGAFMLAAGFLLGLMGLARPNAALFAGAAGVWLWTMIGFRGAAVRLIPIGIIALLVIAPWIARNYGVFGAFVPMALNGGENFYQGNNEYTIPYFRAGYDVQWVPPPANIDLPEAERFGIAANDGRAAAGWAYLRQHPEQIPDLLWTKFLVHWSIEVAPRRNPVNGIVPRLDYQGNPIAATGANGDLALGGLPPNDPVGAYSGTLFDQIGRTVHLVYFGGALALALVGIVLCWRAGGDARRSTALLLLMQVTNTLLYVAFHPSTRYRAPTDPLLFAFSSVTLVTLWETARMRRISHPINPSSTAEIAHAPNV